jgi:flagellin
MSRINTNVQSLIAQRVLGMNNQSLSKSLERLSTGLKINRGKDDPAGLIASESLRSEMKAINAAIDNSERADQVVNIAEGGLGEISNLLTELQGLVTTSANTAGLSKDEKEANQLQVDSILQTIDRIASATSFQGQKLLNGNFDYQVSGVAAGVTDYKINGAKFETGSLSVNVLVTQSSQQAGQFLSMGGTTIDIGTQSSFTLEVAGSLGSRELSFTSSTSLSDIAAAINTFKEVTGVEAAASGTGLSLTSSAFGTEEFVSVKVVDDGSISGTNIGIYDFTADNFNTVDTASKVLFTAAAATNGRSDFGQDIGATINGITATSDGKTARINTDFLDVELTLSTAASQTLGAVNANGAFTITGGGADFQLASKVDIAGKVSIGMTDVASRKLGTSELGFLDDLASGKQFNVVDGTNLTGAQKVIAESIGQVSSLRGRLGAFQANTIGATIRNLGVGLENTAAAESMIRDADFASETAALTRSQILVSASTNILSLANQNPQTALQLLG